MNQEATDKLELVKEWILEAGGVVCPHKYGMCKHDNETCPVFCIDQVLDILKQQPATGEFTENLRKFVKLYENEVPRRAEITFLEESCDRLDRAASTNKDIMETIQNDSDKLDAQIEKGKGIWLQPGYIKDDDWAGMVGERLIYHRVLRLFESAKATKEGK